MEGFFFWKGIGCLDRRGYRQRKRNGERPKVLNGVGVIFTLTFHQAKCETSETPRMQEYQEVAHKATSCMPRMKR